MACFTVVFITISLQILEKMEHPKEKKHPHFEKAKGLMKKRGLLVEMTTRDNGEITYTVQKCIEMDKNDLSRDAKECLSQTDEEFNKWFKELLYKCKKEEINVRNDFIKNMTEEEFLRMKREQATNKGVCDLL